MDQAFENLVDRTLAAYMDHTRDPDLWSPAAAELVRVIALEVGEDLSDDDLGEIMMRARERQQGEQLTKQIRAALKNRPGVTVDRVTISDFPDRSPE